MSAGACLVINPFGLFPHKCEQLLEVRRFVGESNKGMMEGILR